MTTDNPTPVFGRNLVTLDELAKVTRRKVDDLRAEAFDFGFLVGIDWAGRPAIDEQEARQLVTGEHKAAREHDAAWAAHLADCAAWTAARGVAERPAYEEVAARGRRGPDADSAAREAATEAGRRYEQTTPVPLWQGTDSGNAVRRYTERPAEPGLLKRAAGRVKAGAR